MVRAQIGGDLETQPRDGPVALARDLEVVDLVAAVDHRFEALAARLAVLHRPLELHREPPDDRLFGVHVELGAEAAADFGGDRADAVLGKTEDERELRAQQVRDLGRRVERQRLGAGVPARRHRTGFDGDRREPLVHDAHRDLLIGFRERFRPDPRRAAAS